MINHIGITSGSSTLARCYPGFPGHPASVSPSPSSKLMMSTPLEMDIDVPPEEELNTPPHEGLTDNQVQERLLKYGRNELPEKKASALLKFLSYFGGAICILLEIACVVSAIVGDWVDLGILLFVLIVNACIGYFEEAKAESALDALKTTLALRCRARRNSELVEVESSELVPGDVIVLRIGDIIPADARLLGLGVSGEETTGKLKVDQSALTGESLPVARQKGQTVYSSSIVKQGQMLGVVVNTGFSTYVGRAANLIAITKDAGHFQKVVNMIGNFLIIITVFLVVILFFYQKFKRSNDFLQALRSVLILTVAAIPIGLPTVMSVTMAVGASQLAKRQVIVKRLTAIEELASVSVLCSDKTGTLTLNELSFDAPYLATRTEGLDIAEDGPSSTASPRTLKRYSEIYLLQTAFLASEPGAQDAIELAVRAAAMERVPALHGTSGMTAAIPGYKIESFTPFDPSVKYAEATVVNLPTGERFRAIKGAPQVIVALTGGDAEASEAIRAFAVRGLRSLGVARTIDPELGRFELVGLISLLDPPRPDSAATLRECKTLGLSIKMITGDELIIAKEIARRLGMGRCILNAHALLDSDMSISSLTDRVVKADGFAQVIPEHKYRVVELLQDRGYLVGMTGDGVNDAPALKKANVGIAVQGCTDAARSASDIVLLASGLNTIIDGIKTSRAIFQRMRSYSLYRIASTIHFLVFFFTSILILNFSLPDRLIILIAVLNDAATLVISVDNTKISNSPDKWRLGQLLCLSAVLGLCLAAISYAHFFIARDVFQVSPGILQTIMYLQISSCPHFVIFSTRVETWFFESMPSPIFILAIGGTQVFAMFMSIYGVGFFEATPIGWPWGVAILASSVVWFMLLDIIKTLFIRNWSFELTSFLWPTPSRRAEVARRRARKVVEARVKLSIGKVRKVLLICRVVHAFRYPRV
ncbi:H(+)-ATPase [Blyttiomyces helicus]|uniref:Plasma membrane ATPase n=1 Tax=Blyttiomyces helicus TaxID=388810 RepID=A0A4V1IR60_9FUNG|nr:H(+)-ATPase [Blyttiomyces helicus]|eukprot:RKO88927.1 H(+)-ATPase [Blyttiomyces helicus]